MESDYNLVPNEAFDRVERFQNDLRNLKERWDNRLVLERCSLAELYLNGRLEVVLHGDWSGGPADINGRAASLRIAQFCTLMLPIWAFTSLIERIVTTGTKSLCLASLFNSVNDQRCSLGPFSGRISSKRSFLNPGRACSIGARLEWAGRSFRGAAGK